MKKITKTVAIVIALVMLAASLTACKGEEVPKTFTEGGLSITLSNYYETKTSGVYDFCYESDERIVLGKKETLEDLKSTVINAYSTCEQYARLVVENNKLNVEIEEIDGLVAFVYTREVETSMIFSATHTISYMAVVYKTQTAFWLVQFACEADEFDETKPTFISQAKSVTFAE